MVIHHLEIPEVILVIPKRIRDFRGFFSETFNQKTFDNLGISAARFVQDNHALSTTKGTVRGLHFQAPPAAQDKLIRVCRGSIFDVALDIRYGSPTFGKSVGTVISAENWHQIWVPKGFAHGYCTLEPNTEVIYKATGFYCPEAEKGIAWDDPELAIAWPISPEGAVLADRDRRHPLLADLPLYFDLAADVT